MSIYVRDQNRVTFLYESGTYAQPSGASGNWIGLVTAHSPTENENVIEIRYAGTANRNFGQLVNGPKDYEGTISFHPQNFRMVAFALGSCVDTSGTTSVHTISELNSDGMFAYTSGTNQLTNYPSFTIVDSKKGLTDGQSMVRSFRGAVVDTLNITATQGEPITMELGYKAQNFILGSKSADVLPIKDEDTSRPYIWSDVVFHLPSGTVVNEVTEVSYDLENNVENRHYVNGSKVAQAMVPTMRNHTLSLTLDANSAWGKTLEDFHKNGSVFNAMMMMSQSATEYGAFIFSGCKITEFSSPSEVEGIDEYSVTIRPQTLIVTGSDTTNLYNFY